MQILNERKSAPYFKNAMGLFQNHMEIQMFYSKLSNRFKAKTDSQLYSAI